MRKINPWMIITTVLILFIVGMQFQKQITGMFVVQTPQDIGDKVIKYVNDNLVGQNATATFISIKEFNGLYNVTFSYLSQNLSAYATRDGNYIFLAQPLNLSEKPPQPEVPKQTIGSFFIDEKAEICKEDEKPIVHFFGSQRCPNCIWEYPILKNVTDRFKNQISFHENIDTDKDQNLLVKYSPRGYIPVILIGCKYYRVGSGIEIGKEAEDKVLTTLICLVTNNKPLSICAEVENIINQVS